MPRSPGCADPNEKVPLELDPDVVEVRVDGVRIPGRMTSPRPISTPSVKLTPALVRLPNLNIEPPPPPFP